LDLSRVTPEEVGQFQATAKGIQHEFNNMKTRERLLFMALGGLLVLAGMILGPFVFGRV